jgi:hypothetical protein
MWENEETRVELNQTGKSRTKEENHAPSPCLFQNGRAIHSRLRFQASTSHNARTKNNEINPNQQYYRLVVVLQALAHGVMYPILRKISGPLIVRGQNPGRYTSGKTKPQPTQQGVSSVDTISNYNNSNSGIEDNLTHENKQVSSWTKNGDEVTFIEGKVREYKIIYS